MIEKKEVAEAIRTPTVFQTDVTRCYAEGGVKTNDSGTSGAHLACRSAHETVEPGRQGAKQDPGKPSGNQV